MHATSLLALSATARPFLPKDSDILLTRVETAQVLRVSPSTLVRWSRLGIGPEPLRIGSAIRYRLGSVRSALQPLWAA